MHVRCLLLVSALLPLLTGCVAHGRRVALERALKEARDYRASRGFCVVDPEPDPVGDFLAAQGPEALPLYQRLLTRYRRPQNAREWQYLDVGLRGLVVFDLPRSLPKLEALALDMTGDPEVANRALELLRLYAPRADAVRIVGRRLLAERGLQGRLNRTSELTYLGDVAGIPWLERARAQEATAVKHNPERAKLLKYLEETVLLLRTPDTCHLQPGYRGQTRGSCGYFCPGPQSSFTMNSGQACPETSPLPYGPWPEHPKAKPRTDDMVEQLRGSSPALQTWIQQLR